MERNRDDFVIAIRSAFLKKGTQQRFSLLSLILFSIIFLILGNFNLKILDRTKILIKDIVYASSFLTSVPENIIKDSYGAISDHFHFYKKYEEDKIILQKLKNKDLTKKIITFENIELKKLIDDYFVEDSQMYAKVLIDKESPFLRSIIINKGSKNSVKTGMIVYDDSYVVGKVVEVNYLTSRVLLISDINSKVPVTIQPLKLQAIMSGLDKKKGKIQYIKGEKLENIGNQELIVVTSGLGGVFQSGTPIGKLNLLDISNNNEITVDFYKDFSQLKYVKILSHTKEQIKLDQSNKIKFEKNNDKISKLNSQKKDIELLKQQKIINDEIRDQFEKENTELKQKINVIESNLIKIKKNVSEADQNNSELKFLRLNLLHGPKCRKSFIKNYLYKVGTIEYKNCVLNKGVNKN